MLNKIKDIVAASIAVKQQVWGNETLLQTVEAITEVITKAFQQGNKVLFCGTEAALRMPSI